MELDKDTADRITALNLFQPWEDKEKWLKRKDGLPRRRKPGWQVSVRSASGKFETVGVGRILEAAMELAQEAKDHPNEFLERYGKGASAEPVSTWDTLLGEYLNHLDKKHIRGSGVGASLHVHDNFHRAIRFLRAFLKDKPVLQITQTDIQRYYNSMTDRGELATSSCNSYYGRVNSFLNFVKTKYGSRSRYKIGDPVVILEVPKQKRSRKIHCSLEEISLLINSCPDSTDGWKLKFVLYCGFFLGMRKNEISSARKEWFNFETNVLEIPGVDKLTGFTSKDRETRYIPLPEDFVEFMQREWTDWKTGKGIYLIRGKRAAAKKGFVPYDFGKLFKSHCARVGLPHVHIHAMRHSYTTLGISEKLAVGTLAGFLGIGEKVLKEHYDHFEEKHPKLEKPFVRLVSKKTSERISPDAETSAIVPVARAAA